MAETKYFTYEGGIYPYDATYIQGEVKHSVQDFLQEYDKRVKGYQVPALVVDNGETALSTGNCTSSFSRMRLWLS